MRAAGGGRCVPHGRGKTFELPSPDQPSPGHLFYLALTDGQAMSAPKVRLLVWSMAARMVRWRRREASSGEEQRQSYEHELTP